MKRILSPLGDSVISKALGGVILPRKGKAWPVGEGSVPRVCQVWGLLVPRVYQVWGLAGPRVCQVWGLARPRVCQVWGWQPVFSVDLLSHPS